MIIWHVFIFNYVEFTQGKLRIARDTTVNDYLYCKGVKGAKFWPIFHTQFVDKWHVWFVGLCVDGSANYSSQVLHVAYLPISGSYFSRCLFLKGILELMYHTAVTTPSTLRLLLARTTPGPQRSRAESRRILLARDYSWTVTPGSLDCESGVTGQEYNSVPGVVAYEKWPITARTAPHVTNHDDACRMQISRRARSSRLGSQKEE